MYVKLKQSNDSDCLMHFKYIKRYRENGKWRYIYPGSKTINAVKRDIKETADAIGDKVRDVAGVDEKKYLQATQKWLENSEDRLTKASNERKAASENHRRATDNVILDNSAGNRDKLSWARAELVETSRNEAHAQSDYNKKKAQVNTAKANYDKTILGVSEKAVAKGQAFLDKLFKKKR